MSKPIDIFLHQIENESAIETKPLITVVVQPSYDDNSAQTNHISPTVMIPFGTNFQYTEYHPIDGDASGRLGEFNDLNDDIFSEYFEDSKIDIVPIQTDDHTNANDVTKMTQRQTLHEHKCIDCDQEFSSESSLKTHRAIHMGGRSYECWLCHEM